MAGLGEDGMANAWAPVFEQMLQRGWLCLKLMRAPKRRRLPVGLSHQEVQRLFNQVRFPIYRACLTTIDSRGPRISEGGSPPSGR